ncbi:hypothetical protein PGTUg99_018322 [Puccinia graminis f. sp. tritici]|nr:hypothetical protein PGTUg99_018322 [Puccinia graminis f. sp. tritici]
MAYSLPAYSVSPDLLHPANILPPVTTPNSFTFLLPGPLSVDSRIKKLTRSGYSSSGLGRFQGPDPTSNSHFISLGIRLVLRLRKHEASCQASGAHSCTVLSAVDI